MSERGNALVLKIVRNLPDSVLAFIGQRKKKKRSFLILYMHQHGLKDKQQTKLKIKLYDIPELTVFPSISENKI